LSLAKKPTGAMHVFANFGAKRAIQPLGSLAEAEGAVPSAFVRGAKLLLPYSGMWAHH
jgi:hypothetical protein